MHKSINAVHHIQKEKKHMINSIDAKKKKSILKNSILIYDKKEKLLPKWK